MSTFLAEEFRSIINELDAINSPSVNEADESEAKAKAAYETLSELRAIAKQHERGDQPPLPDNFANKVANDLWQVMSWMEHNVPGSHY